MNIPETIEQAEALLFIAALAHDINAFESAVERVCHNTLLDAIKAKKTKKRSRIRV